MAEYYHRVFPDKFSLLDKISYLQRAIIMASITYYELNSNVMSDMMYDGISRQLVELTAECQKPEDSQYWYVFKDFDGNTGFDLKDRLNDKDRDYLTRLALCALHYSGAGNKGKKVASATTPSVTTTKVDTFSSFVTEESGQMSLF